MLIERIAKENDIKHIEMNDMPQLAEEIRDFLIEKVSKTGGHVASNLGVVELTMALHLSLDLPQDKIIWDVGHQSYTHKILTGRKEGFNQLRKYGGMSGFPKRSESSCDPFDTGHSSTSISAGLGFVQARDVKKENYHVLSVIGDGSLTGGMAYEALNNASELKTNFIIVLNDNAMSISKNVGGISRYLGSIRTTDAYAGLKKGVVKTLEHIPLVGKSIERGLRKIKNSFKQWVVVSGMFFEDMGITYLGPIDGHNIKELMRAFAEAKRVKGPVLVHVLTQKGKGYTPAEEQPSKFHGLGPFYAKTGAALQQSESETYTNVFSRTICELATKREDVVAITAAMDAGTGLATFRESYPHRFFDVGIAEAHAVTFAAGLAAGGLKPIFAVYSSFLQRGYDQVLHDVCLQNLPVVFAIDRAGLVGDDGETHQGIFDLSYLSMIPNMTIMSPKNKWELEDMLNFAVAFTGPIALRYPRGIASEVCETYRAPIRYGESERIYEEDSIVILVVGHMCDTGMQVRKKLKEIGYNCSLVNARFVKPIDEKQLQELAKEHTLFVTIEENVAVGGYGDRVKDFVMRQNLNVKVLNIALPDEYVEHGNIETLRAEVLIDVDSVVKKTITAYIGK